MATTLYALGLMTAAESWRAVRTIRAEPQGALDRVLRRDKTRRREFHMALEQSQQQFAAAERIGYESRPLNLFYGLSQAGRAIAAGSNLLGPGTGQQWQATGHGLQYDVSIPQGVFTTPITQEGAGKRDLFSRVSIALGSPRDFDSVEFGAAVNQLLDYTMEFREPEGYARPVSDVVVTRGANLTFPHRLEVLLPGDVTGNESPEDVLALLAPYPAFSGLDIARDDSGNVLWSHNKGRCYVVIERSDQLEERRDGHSRALQRTATYRRSQVALPRAGTSENSLAPLMSWWVVLYALSMLARYAPSNWTSTLSLSESRIASRIEFLLDTATEAVPELVWSQLKLMSEEQ